MAPHNDLDMNFRLAFFFSQIYPYPDSDLHPSYDINYESH